MVLIDNTRRERALETDYEIIADAAVDMSSLSADIARDEEDGRELDESKLVEVIGVQRMIADRAQSFASTLREGDPKKYLESAAKIDLLATRAVTGLAENLIRAGNFAGATHYLGKAQEMTYQLAQQQQALQQMGNLRGEREEPAIREAYRRPTQTRQSYSMNIILFLAGTALAFIASNPQITGGVIGVPAVSFGGIFGILLIFVSIISFAFKLKKK